MPHDDDDRPYNGITAETRSRAENHYSYYELPMKRRNAIDMPSVGELSAVGNDDQHPGLASSDKPQPLHIGFPCALYLPCSHPPGDANDAMLYV